jgi:hypothetical protein
MGIKKTQKQTTFEFNPAKPARFRHKKPEMQS